MKFFDLYCSFYPIDQRVGITLCKKGEMRGRLSTYYVRIRDCAEIISRILIQIVDLDETTKDECDDLLTRWGVLETFVTYEYCAKHLELDSRCKHP